MTAARQVINPWTWQDQFGFAQATITTAPQRLLLCAGQASSDADGTVLHPGDIGAQLTQSLDNHGLTSSIGGLLGKGAAASAGRETPELVGAAGGPTDDLGQERRQARHVVGVAGVAGAEQRLQQWVGQDGRVPGRHQAVQAVLAADVLVQACTVRSGGNVRVRVHRPYPLRFHGI